MADGDFSAGDKATQGLAGAIIEERAAPEGASTKDRLEIRICRTMSHQRSDPGGPSQPQKFVRLIGCQDSRSRQTGARLPRAVTG